MYEPSINYLAVIVGTIAHYMLGALWYSPVLFSRAWIGAVGWGTSQHLDSPVSSLNNIPGNCTVSIWVTNLLD